MMGTVARVSTAITLVMCLSGPYSSRGFSTSGNRNRNLYSQCDSSNSREQPGGEEAEGDGEGGDDGGVLAMLRRLLREEAAAGSSSLPDWSSASPLDAASAAVFLFAESGVPGKLGYGFIMVCMYVRGHIIL